MDQVKQILAVLKKYHFWVLCGLLLLIGLGVWQMAVATLAARYKERENKLTSQRKAVADIAKEPSPPNQAVIDLIQKAHEGLKDEVANASAFLYRMQKAKNPWPVKVLGEAFVEAAEALKPGDNYMKPGEEFKDEKYLESYQNFISMHLPKLGLIVDVRERKSEQDIRKAPPQEKRILVRKRDEKKKAEEEAEKKDSKAKTPSPDEGEDEVVGKVYWDNEMAVVHRYDQWWETRPTTMQVLIAQEDIWVYEALLRIIRDTNEEASTYFKAPVKRIVSLDIGQDAARGLGGSTRSSSGGGSGGSMTLMGGGMPGMTGGMPGMTGGMPGMPGSGAPGMMGGTKSATLMGPSGAGTGSGMPIAGPGGGGGGDAGASPREAIARSLLDGRYVDAKGQPLAYGTDPLFKQFKMMPVRMVLVVDQRKIPRLLAQCANSSMPVEVKRVNLHFGSGQSSSPAGGRSGGGSGGMPGMPGGMPGMTGGAAGRPGAATPGMAGAMGAMPGAMPAMGKSGSGASARSGATPGAMGAASGMSGSTMARSSGSSRDEQTPWEATMELEGIIYIFVPPDTSTFASKGAAAASAAGQTGSEPAAAPAGAPTASGAAAAPGSAPKAAAPAGTPAPGAAPAGTPTPAAPGPGEAPGTAEAATAPAAAPAAAPPPAVPPAATPTPKK